MLTLSQFSFQKLKERLSLSKPWNSVIILILNILVTIPIFIIAHQNLIELNWKYHLDRILLFLLILVAIQLILRLMKTFIVLCIFAYLLVLTYGTFFGNYGFQKVYEDYRYMIYAMAENPKPQDIIISKLLPFPNKSKIIDAVDYTNPKVRNFALSATTKHFKNVKYAEKDRLMIQCFAVFKEIKERWNYVNDPKGSEYIAYASESLQHFSGDCDDHAVLMAACIKAIGGSPRLIHTGWIFTPKC